MCLWHYLTSVRIFHGKVRLYENDLQFLLNQFTSWPINCSLRLVLVQVGEHDPRDLDNLEKPSKRQNSEN